MKDSTFRLGALIAAIILIVTICFSVPSVRGTLMDAFGASNTQQGWADVTTAPQVTPEPYVTAEPQPAQRTVYYFNSEVCGENMIGAFGPDRKAMAESGNNSNLCNWVATSEGMGNFFESIAVDPALCAAVAVHMEQKLKLAAPILWDEQNYSVDQRANLAHLHFLRDYNYWDRTVQTIKSILCSGRISIVKLKDNTATLYMWRNGLEGDKPAVVYGDAQNANMLAVKFDLLDAGSVRFTLANGYQPTGVTYWPNEEVEPEIEPEPEEVVATPTPVPVIVTEAPVITAEPVQHATHTVIGQIRYKIDGEWIVLDMIRHDGGYFACDDPKYSDLPMENEDSYGPSLVRNTKAETFKAWVYTLPYSPEQIVRLLVQAGELKLSPLKSESDYAHDLEVASTEEYDRMANLALSYIYKVDGGSVPFDFDWTLENMMTIDKTGTKWLFGRLRGDDDKGENRDPLFTLLDKNGKPILAAPLGLENTAKDANANPKDFNVIPYIDATEGGTYKWRPGTEKVTPTPPPPTPTPTPTDPPPTPTPTPTDPPPTPTPTPTDPPPTPTPTPTDPPPTPTPTPTDPPPTPTPSPTPTLEPKPSDAGPQGQTDDDTPGTEDFGGGPNHDTDTTYSEEEPESPETYEPPAPPKPDPTATPTPKPTNPPATATPKPDKPTPTPTPVVVTGAPPQQTLEEVQEEEHDESTVEEPLQGDVNEGDLDESEVE